MKFVQLKKFFDLDINNNLIDLNQQEKVSNYNLTPLSFCFYKNSVLNLNISVEQFDYLICNTDLNIKSDNGFIASSWFFIHFKSKDPKNKISQKSFDYLVKNSPLNGSLNTFYFLLMKKYKYNSLNEINISFDLINDIYEKTLKENCLNISNQKEEFNFFLNERNIFLEKHHIENNISIKLDKKATTINKI